MKKSVCCLCAGFLLSGCSETTVERNEHEIRLEFEQTEVISRTILYCNTEGLTDSEAELFSAWADSRQADLITVCGPLLPELDPDYHVFETSWAYVASQTEFDYSPKPALDDRGVVFSVDGLNYTVADFDPSEDLRRQLDELLEAGYNCPGRLATEWFVVGSFYYYSMMEAGYDGMPEWFPADAMGDEFDADRYAWQNNLYDCIWMLHREWTPTYTSPDGRSWRADYLYASKSAWNLVTSVSVLEIPVTGMRHNPILFTIKY